MSSPVYSALKIFLRQVTGNYFRNIHVTGVENMPMEGPTILCCNHSNQFMDGMLIIAQCPRQLSFCFAASSFNKPIVGYLAKKINVIPVYRAEDSKINGKGKIIMTSDTDIQGFKTKFISEPKKNKNFKFGVHSIIIKKKYKLIVEKIIDEEHIKVRSDQKIFEILKKEDKQSFQFIPKIDNSLMFKETCQKLKEEKAICIFPEGTSHDRTHLLKLKPGVAYIALEAMANYGIKHINIISCGFTYFSRDEFRSDVVLQFGVPFEIPESLGEAFKVNKKQAIDLVLKIVETQIRSTILTTPTYKEYMLIKMLRNLYIPSDSEITAEISTDIARRISHFYNYSKDTEKTKNLKVKVMEYIDILEKLGLEDNDFKGINLKSNDKNMLMEKFLFSLILFIIGLILAIPMIVFIPLIILVRSHAEKERAKALEKNPNKIEAKDVVSSVKVVTFCKYLPIVAIFWVLLFYKLTNYLLANWIYSHFPSVNLFFVGCICFLFYGYLSINIFDRLKYHLKTMKTLFYYFIVPKGFYYLKDMRKKLHKEVKDFVNENIKDTQYENNRIINFNKERTFSL